MFPVFLSVTTYFLTCAFFTLLLDVIGQNVSWIKKYKIQTDQVVGRKQILRAVTINMFNNLLIVVPSFIMQAIWVPDTPLPPKAPDMFTFISQQFLMLMMFDFQHGLWHLIHHKVRWLYRNFHSVHHQFHSSFSWVTQVAHPWEIFTVGTFVTVNGWLFNAHPMTYWSYMALNVFVSVESHSGYDLPLTLDKIIPFGIYGGAIKHDMHHMKPLTNFQPFFSTWDRLIGTECPGIKAGNRKPPQLIEWEERNKSKRFAKHARDLMGGTGENGFLSPEKLSLKDKHI